MTDHFSPPLGLAQDLINGARTVVIATIDPMTGHPAGAVVLSARDEAGKPMTLISTHGRHTRHLTVNPLGALIYDGGTLDASHGDRSDVEMLAGNCLTVFGTFRRKPDVSSALRAAFLDHHPYAREHVDFGDFAFWTLEPAGAHLMAGTGLVHTLTTSEILAAPTQ